MHINVKKENRLQEYLRLREEGKTIMEIAALYGITKQAVSYTLKGFISVEKRCPVCDNLFTTTIASARWCSVTCCHREGNHGLEKARELSQRQYVHDKNIAAGLIYCRWCKEWKTERDFYRTHNRDKCIACCHKASRKHYQQRKERQSCALQ